MTEITETKDKSNVLPHAVETFVLNWGDLGNKWGVNRSVSQIHAYLYLADEPTAAEQIAADLEMARSNVSNSLRELLNWRLISRVPVRGDRRDHFLAETDVWEIAARIATGRKEREIDPARETLRTCVQQANEDPRISTEKRQKLQAMLEFTESVDSWYNQMLSLPKSRRVTLLKLGAKVASYLPGSKEK